MNARDLELLCVARKLNSEMGVVVAILLDHMVDGQLPADKLREFADIARDMAEAFESRADEIDQSGDSPRVIDSRVL